MEYMPKGSLESLLEKYGRFDRETVRYFTAQIICGLEYLHS